MDVDVDMDVSVNTGLVSLYEMNDTGEEDRRANPSI